jgi:hypothetical protein
LEILEIRPSCSCTKIVLEEPRIPAGETRNLELLVSIHESGVRSAAVTLRTNATDDPECHVSVHWKGMAPFECETPQVAFDDVLPESRHTREIRLRRQIPEGRMQGVTSTNPELRIGPLVDTDEYVAVPLELLAGVEPGPKTARLLCRIDEGWPPEWSIPVTWRVRELVEAEPNPVFLGSVPAGMRTRQRVVLSGHHGALIVVDPQPSEPLPPGLMITTGPLDEGRLAVDVEWTAPETPGLRRGTVALTVLEPRSSTLSIEWFGYVLGSADKEAQDDSPKN